MEVDFSNIVDGDEVLEAADDASEAVADAVENAVDNVKEAFA